MNEEHFLGFKKVLFSSERLIIISARSEESVETSHPIKNQQPTNLRQRQNMARKLTPKHQPTYTNHRN